VAAHSGIQRWTIMGQKLNHHKCSDGSGDHFVLSADGKVMVEAVAKNINMWDATSGKRIRSLVAAPGHRLLSLSPDGKMIAVARVPDKPEEVPVVYGSCP
jgi:WD40 repeat protein